MDNKLLSARRIQTTMNRTMTRLGFALLAGLFAPSLLAANLQRVDVASLPGDRVELKLGFDEPVAPNAIELYVARLRKKLEPDGPQIRTIRGLGYLMEGA